MEDLGRVKEGHQVVMQALQQQAKEGQEKAEETKSAVDRWQEERSNLLERVRELESRNTDLSVQLSKHENVSADLPHLSQRLESIGSGVGGLTLTWNPSAGQKDTSNVISGHPTTPLSSEAHGERQSTKERPQSPPLATETPGRVQSHQRSPHGVADVLRLIQMSRSANTAAAARTTTLEAETRSPARPTSASGTAGPPAPVPHDDQRMTRTASERAQDYEDARKRLSPGRVSGQPRDLNASDGTRNAIEFAVKLKQWLLSEMQKGAAAVNEEALDQALNATHEGASRFKSQLYQSQDLQLRPRFPPHRAHYAAASRISSPPPPIPHTSPPPPAPSPPPAVESLWSRNASLL